jgi:diguanylate cyclase (GGDEF)-like protein
VRSHLRRSFHVVLAAVAVMVFGFIACAGLIVGRIQPQLHAAVLAARDVRVAHENMINQETGVRGYLLSRKSSAREFLQPYYDGQLAASDAFDATAPLVKGHPDDEKRLAATIKASQVWNNSWAQLAIANPSFARDANAEAFLDEGRYLFDTYRISETALVDALTARANRHLHDQRVMLEAMLVFAVGVGVIAVAAVGMQQRRLTRRLVTPVQDLMHAVRGVRDGVAVVDTATVVSDTTPTEIRELWEDFASMTVAVDSRATEAAKERESLLTLSEVDPLTGLFNRRRLDADLTQAFTASSMLSLVMVDIDFFKRLNDTHGHAAGDDTLRAVAAVIDRAVRGGDTAYRLGGEEFLVVLPGTDLPGAIQLAERVRSRVAESTGVTVSCGVATRGDATTILELLGAADDALYAAKATGRDRVCTSPSARSE